MTFLPVVHLAVIAVAGLAALALAVRALVAARGSDRLRWIPRLALVVGLVLLALRPGIPDGSAKTVTADVAGDADEHVDITDAAAVERIVLHVEQHLGTVDLLVNNAAVIERTEVPFARADLADVWRVVETNLHGPLIMTRALLPPMIERGHGHVVNITSRARAATKSGTYTGYAVSKRALTAFTESLVGPLTGTGVVAIDVLPGLVRTDMTASMPVWLG